MTEYLECPVCGEDAFEADGDEWCEMSGPCPDCGAMLSVHVDEHEAWVEEDDAFDPCPHCGEVTLCPCAGDETAAERGREEDEGR